ncbi:phospholipase/lecithinase/hemolysin [Polymorphobacter fuscus]|nr:SGNH/GDSL hydrolase family protein [Polymorphobacter fuscus]NJC08569.1 phospholipase/lecithinase/hemolysin [Polymorphobacter fuscus]
MAIAVPAAALTPSTFYVFGDSFTDAGNIAAATGNTIPDASQGFWYGRFADGPTWVDRLSYAQYGAPTVASLNGGNNFSFGGARAAQDDIISAGPPVVAIPGLASQAGLYFSQVGFVDPNALYIVNFGNNDVNAIQGTDADREGLTVAQYQAAYVNNMVGAVSTLSAFGAQNILVLGVPNPLEVEGLALQGLLDTALDAVEPGLSANLYRYSYFSFFTRLQADPTQFGLPQNLDFNTPCLAAVTPGPGIDCTGYLSFDGIHVTSKVQQALARDIGGFVGLNDVPEPSTWAMLIAGFGLVGTAMRRKGAAANA